MRPAVKIDQHSLYWKASDHQWGKGKTHVIDEDGERLLCGRLLVNCPGRYVRSNEHEYNCQACAGVVDSRARHERDRLRNEALARGNAEKEAERRANWQDWYAGYLVSSKWKGKRDRVIEREHGVCEACRRRPATEVHHETYKHVGNEPLFELRAVCRQCHAELTDEDRRQRGELAPEEPGEGWTF